MPLDVLSSALAFNNRGLAHTLDGEGSARRRGDPSASFLAAVDDFSRDQKLDPTLWKAYLNEGGFGETWAQFSGGAQTEAALNQLRSAERAMRSALDVNPNCQAPPHLERIRRKIEAATEF